jgi:ferric-dicitrate binding protein FerR (iron transport regulator)
MKFDSPSADALRRVDLVVNNGGAPNVAPLPLRRKGRPAARLAFAAGLLVAAVAAMANAPAWPQPTAERAGTGHIQDPS